MPWVICNVCKKTLAKCVVRGTCRHRIPHLHNGYSCKRGECTRYAVLAGCMPVSVEELINIVY